MSSIAYVGTTKRFLLNGLTYNGTLIRADTSGKTITLSFLDGANAAWAPANPVAVAELAGSPGTWYADVTLPDTPMTLRARWVVTKDGATEKFQTKVTVKAFS